MFGTHLGKALANLAGKDVRAKQTRQKHARKDGLNVAAELRHGPDQHAKLTLELSGAEAVRLERIVSRPQCANKRKQTSAKPATSMSQRVMPEIG